MPCSEPAADGHPTGGSPPPGDRCWQPEAWEPPAGGEPPSPADHGLLVLQLADSAFPAGGFVHSGGLESAFQLGLVGRDRLADWLADGIEQAGWGQLPWATAAHRGDDLADLDRRCDAWLTVGPANRASRTQGQAWLATAATVFTDRPGIVGLKRSVRAAGLPGHLAPVFGRLCALLGLPAGTAQRLFLFLHLRGLASTAVRLGICGPMEAQRIQAALAPVVGQVLAACAGLEPGSCATTSPLVDLAHGHHDRLYSRLFAT